MDKVTDTKLEKYFEVTKKALEKAEKSGNRTNLKEEREDFLSTDEEDKKENYRFLKRVW